MVAKKDIISTLEKLRTEENNTKVQQYIDMINSLDDTFLNAKLKEKGLKSKWQIRRFVKNDIKQQEQSKFIELNELVSYGTRGRTLHIHVVPKDLHNMLNREGLKRGELELIDALERIQDILKTNKKLKNIEHVFAVSGLIARPVSRIFDNLDFDVKSMKSEQAKEDPELKKFYEMFKEHKHIGSAILAKEKLFSDEWNELKETRKKTLQQEIKNKFEEKLQQDIKPEDEINKYNDKISKEKVISEDMPEIC